MLHDNRPSHTVLAAHLEGETVLLEMDHKRYYRLNDTGQAIWRALEAGRHGDALVRALTDDYEVDEATARAEIDRFLADCAAAGLVRPADPDA